MKRLLRTLILLPMFLGITPALAQQPPWEGQRPAGMTAAHDRYAASAFEVYTRLGRDFNGNPRDFHQTIWTWENGRNGLRPLSNMDGPTISAVRTGRYFVFRHPDVPSYWSVSYDDPNGVTHFCVAQPNGTYREHRLDRYVNDTVFGLSGIFHWDPEREDTRRPNLRRNPAFPLVGDGRTGTMADFRWNGQAWTAAVGWVQSEYAAAFAERCPNLPRVADVNTAQTGRTVEQLRRNARPVGFRTAFENDPADPLTVNMFYWAHPPR